MTLDPTLHIPWLAEYLSLGYEGTIANRDLGILCSIQSGAQP